MFILDAALDDRYHRLHLLVDRRPETTDMTWTAHPYEVPESAHGRRDSGVLYLATEPPGYVSFLVDTGDPTGHNGATFTLPMRDGTETTLTGPWSGSAGFVTSLIPHLPLYTDRDVCVHEARDRDNFERRSGGWVGYLTVDAAAQATALAATNHVDVMRARVDPEAVRSWWSSPAAAHADAFGVHGNPPAGTVGEYLAISEVPDADSEDATNPFPPDADDELPTRLPALVSGANAAGLFGVLGHDIQLLNLATGDGEHDGYLLTVHPPVGPRLASSPLSSDDLVDFDLFGVEQVVGVLDAVALTVNELLDLHRSGVTARTAVGPAAARERGESGAVAVAAAFDPVPGPAAQSSRATGTAALRGLTHPSPTNRFTDPPRRFAP